MLPKSLYKNIKNTFLESFTEAVDDKIFKMSAALSYYTVFSIGPLLVITLYLGSIFFSYEAATGRVFSELRFIIGAEGAQLLQDAINKMSRLGEGTFATAVSIIILAFGIFGVFLELKESLNIIWGVESKPGVMLKSQIFNGIMSFSMVLAMGFLLVVSLVITAAINAAMKYFEEVFSLKLPVLAIANHLIVFVLLAIIFAMIFKYLPSVEVKWRFAWQGGLLTSLLFNLGKFLIGWYISSSAMITAYGAAGSFILILLWIYYSGLIFYFGAEFTQIWRRKFDPNPLVVEFDAVQVKKATFVIKEAMEKAATGSQDQNLFEEK